MSKETEAWRMVEAVAYGGRCVSPPVPMVGKAVDLRVFYEIKEEASSDHEDFHKAVNPAF